MFIQHPINLFSNLNNPTDGISYTPPVGGHDGLGDKDRAGPYLRGSPGLFELRYSLGTNPTIRGRKYYD